MNKILLGSAVTVLLLTGCGDEKKATSESTTKVVAEQTTAKEVVAEATKEVSTTVSKASTEVANTVSEATSKVVEKSTEMVKETTANAIETAKESVSTVAEKTVEKVEEIKVVAQEAITNAEQTVSAIVNDGLDGEVLYKSCASCHGQKAEKEALGKSQIIAGWEKEKIIQALNGYKDGSYGGVMKNIMKGQIASKTDAEIDALATFISNL